MTLLQDILIILAASIVVILISSRLKLPAVAGFLVTGILIGPHALGLVKDTTDIDLIAEIGIVLMIFVIGIEFSLSKLKQIRTLFLKAGGGQVIITTLAVVAISLFLGKGLQSSIFFGFLVSLSSTAIVLKLLQDRGELDSPQGKINLGILLFQDLCVVPMIVLVPILALKSPGEEAGIENTIMKIFIALISVVVIFIAARFLMPPVLNLIVKTRLKEIFIIGSLFLCLGMAYATHETGLSLALGAFIAGIIISESRYSPQVVADILPFKESFNSIFFISVGMLLDLKYVYENYIVTLGFGAGIFLLKMFIILALVLLLKYPFRIALISGMGLAQIGEFSFIIAKLGFGYGLISGELYQTFLASSILTMIFTPFAFNLSPKVAIKLQKGKLVFPLKRKTVEEFAAGKDTVRAIASHVIIVGAGVSGKTLGRALNETGVPYLFIELNPDTVKQMARDGEIMVYGDTSRETILKEAQIKSARAIVFLISDPFIIHYAISSARRLNKDIFIIVRTKHVSDIDRLYESGADAVFAEEFEASIEIVAQVMGLYGLPPNIINTQINIIHQQRYGLLRGVPALQSLTDQVARIIAAGTTEVFYVMGNSNAANKSIGELALRSKTGATVISVVRGNEHFPNPGPKFVFKEGDMVVLTGIHKQVDEAVRYLS
jgi:CPA2 family monovalent cation:H+ antiporter-2